MADSSHVSTFTDLSEIYTEDIDQAKERYARIENAFKKQFNSVPDFYARSPGRVNLIGEHIDYEGYGVLPMAIALDTVVAVRKHGNDVIVANTDHERYPMHQFVTDPSQPVDSQSGEWTNYFLAAYKGVYEFLENAGIAHSHEFGMEILVDGQVPAGSGLSSSSALVCAAAIAILAVQGLVDKVSKSELAHLTKVCERYSGTESGGMDQAIAIMAQPGFAKFIEFDPVRGTDVSLPKSGVFVVANSLTPSHKAETADQRYNLRVIECHAAALMLGFYLGLPTEQNLEVEILKDIENLSDLDDRSKRVLENTALAGDYQSKRSLCIALVKKCLTEQNYSLAEIEAYLNFPMLRIVEKKSANGTRVLRNLASDSGDRLALYNRALHVYNEAQRVEEMKAVCDLTVEMAENEKLKRIGELMNASHASCRDLYECSSPELEELVSVCNAFGALGCRLTGAGWGGCVVALIHESQQSTFIQNVKKAFYEPKVKSPDEVDLHIFASKPSSSAAAFKPLTTFTPNIDKC